MKKTLSLLLTAIILGINTGTAIAMPPAQDNVSIMHRQSRAQMRREFEQRLNLTDKQKEKAKQLHKQGREQIQPVIMQIEVKRQEIETVKLSRISVKMQEEKIAQLNAEIKELEKQVNKKQRAELEKMKAEGRARFEQKHPPRAPFQGLGTPNFLLRPLLPLPHENH